MNQNNRNAKLATETEKSVEILKEQQQRQQNKQKKRREGNQ